METCIRSIQVDDAQKVLSIYQPYIERTAISFETSVPTLKEFKDRITNISAFYPWLVVELNNNIVGYAYATSHRQREAYKWSVDVAIYLDKDHHSKGYGALLYSNLFEILKQQGFCTLYAGITLPGEKSVGLHEKMGFQKIAEYNQVGYKFGQWWNVGWWEFKLKKQPSKPKEPISWKKLPL